MRLAIGFSPSAASHPDALPPIENRKLTGSCFFLPKPVAGQFFLWPFGRPSIKGILAVMCRICLFLGSFFLLGCTQAKVTTGGFPGQRQDRLVSVPRTYDQQEEIDDDSLD